MSVISEEFELNSEQNDIINYDSNLVVIAAPGSGKTTVISEKIKCILNTLPDYKGVIAISYTNKASDELKLRSLKNGIPKRKSFFGTIDKFCISEIIIPFATQLFGKVNKEFEIIRREDLKEKIELLDGEEISLEDNPKILDDNSIFEKLFIKGFIILELVGAFALFLLRNSKSCRNYMKARYSHILIDEYQDSGTEQHNLFLFLVELGLTGIAVGDVNQSIFAFDGKSSEYLTLLPNHGFKLFPLDINHRSHPSIINYSNRFLSTNSNNIETKEIMVFEKCCIGDESSIARWIGQKVPIFENEFDVKNRGQIGILVSNNSSGNFYDDNLTIPHQLITTSPLEHHSFTLSRLFTSLLYFYYDYSINALDIITNFNRNNEKSLIKKIQSNILNLRSFPIDLQIIDKFIEIASLLIPNTMNERSINLLTDVIQSENYLSSFKLPEESNVQIMTIHKAKGSEFDIVFHMNLYEWTLPRKSINEKRSSYFIDWDQDVNLHYVALTRARKALFLCYSTKRHNSKGMEKDGNPSEFLQINNLKNMRKII